MNFKSKTSGLVLATVFGLGMVSSSLASAQNRGVQLPLLADDENSGISNEENTAQEDFVANEIEDTSTVAETVNDEGLGKIQEDSATSCETDSKLVSTDKLSPKSGDAGVGGKGTLFGSIGATAAISSAVTEGISSKIASSKNNNDKVSGTNEELEKLEKRIE